MASSPRRTAGSHYAASGVDRTAVSAALAALLREVRFHPPARHGRLVPAAGHYAGLLRIGAETIAVTTDTVGTKVLLAEALGRWEEVGEDLVGANVNDLAAVGARAAGLVDTILCRTPDRATFRAIGRGIDRGLRAANCSLLGGETAVVPEIVAGTDLGATAFGFFPRGRSPILGTEIREGDRLVGIPSNGFHANGFTLVRRLLREHSVDLGRPRAGGRIAIGRELLRPTRIYCNAVESVADLSGVHGLAHISGGGVRNLVRLAPNRRFVLDQWPEVPAVFGWLAQLGDLPPAEMFETFNQGIGFVVVAAPRAVPDVLRRLGRAGAQDARIIGSVARGSGVTVPAHDVSYEGYS